MQSSDQEKAKPSIVVDARELATLAEGGLIKIEAKNVRYSMMAHIAKINGGKSAFPGGDDPTAEEKTA